MRNVIPPLVALMAAFLAQVADPALGQTRLPDTEITQWRGYSAWLVDPTDRYDHGVLGDAIEAGGFVVRSPEGRTLVFRLDQDSVFEDRRVRLEDIDGDGRPEAVVIKSHRKAGARAAIYKIGPDAITPWMQGPTIGRSHRWLNIIGIADFDGDGSKDIAYVQTPHLAGIIRVFSLKAGAFREIGRKAGYTNHVIGSRELDLAQVLPHVRGALIRIPALGLRSMATLGMREGKLVELSRTQR